MDGKASEAAGGKMTKAYLYYPRPHMRLHGDSACSEIGKNTKKNQRKLIVKPDSLAELLSRLSDPGFRLASCAEYNDVWFDLDLGSSDSEEVAANEALRVLAIRYEPLRGSRRSGTAKCCRAPQVSTLKPGAAHKKA